jgi:NADPH:quinone reductase-like Zn-dependent oxidoreductase
MENSRRTFIKKSTLGVAGMTIGGIGMSANSYSRIIGASDRLNVAIVGLGRRLGAFTEPIAMKEANVQLLYLCDVMASQRLNAAKRFGGVIHYSPSLENDVRRIYDDKKVDAIIDEGVISTHLGHLANIASRIGKGFDVNVLTGQALDRDALKLWSREYEPGWEPNI